MNCEQKVFNIMELVIDEMEEGRSHSEVNSDMIPRRAALMTMVSKHASIDK